jgi:hypothetical protein
MSTAMQLAVANNKPCRCLHGDWRLWLVLRDATRRSSWPFSMKASNKGFFGIVIDVALEELQAGEEGVIDQWCESLASLG